MKKKKYKLCLYKHNNSHIINENYIVKTNKVIRYKFQEVYVFDFDVDIRSLLF